MKIENPVEQTAVQPADRLEPPDTFDPVIGAYKKDIDRTLIRENLKLSYQERLRKLERTIRFFSYPLLD